MQYAMFIFTVIAVVVVAKLFSWPLKKILKLLLNIALGIIMILLVNTFGGNIGLHIPFNFVTAIVSGILGIPGVIALIILNYIF